MDADITTFDIAEKLERIARDLRVRKFRLDSVWELSSKDEKTGLKYTLRFEREKREGRRGK